MKAKTMWGVRHIRYWWHRYWFYRWFRLIGCRLGAFPNESDLEYLDAIRRGEA